MTSDTQRGFDRWIDSFFNQSVAAEYWRFPKTGDWWVGDWWNNSPAETIAHLTRTFEECETVLAPFSDAQVAQALYFMLSGSGYMPALKDTSIPLPDRLRCIHSMSILFERCFARRLPPDQSHLEGTNPLHHVCYAWWDVLPLHYLAWMHPEHPDGAELDRAILEVLEHLLKLDSVACWEGALEALATWTVHYGKARRILNAFLKDHRAILRKFDPALAAYILGAR